MKSLNMMNNKSNQKKREETDTVTDLIEKSQQISDSWLEKGLPQKPKKNEPEKSSSKDNENRK